MKVITITNFKGGVCKTTTAQCLTYALRLKGFKTLLIDADSQTNLTKLESAENNAFTLLHVLRKPPFIINAVKNDFIAASSNLNIINNELIGTNKEYKLKEALQLIKNKYDFVIIDASGVLDLITINVLTASDYIVIPTTAEMLSLEAINETIQAVNDIKELTNNNLNVLGFLLVKYRNNTVLSRLLKENAIELAKAYNTKVFNTYIRNNIAIAEAQLQKQNIFTYDIKSNGAKDYLTFTEELLKDI